MFWIAFGDVHESAGALSSIPGVSEAAGLIVSGDLTNRGTAAAAKQVIDTCTSVNPRLHAQIGNMDTRAVDELLTAQGVNLHRRVVELATLSVRGGPVRVGLAGVGWSTPTPFGTPSEAEEETLDRWLRGVEARCTGFDRLMVAIHTPPINTATDRLSSGAHVGSPAVRAFLERLQPDVCITGHIHESRAMDRVGETTVINPGMLAHGGYARIVLSDGGQLDATLERA